jgi:branched-chain amino acid transport system ATP-binding protein
MPAKAASSTPRRKCSTSRVSEYWITRFSLFAGDDDGKPANRLTPLMTSGSGMTEATEIDRPPAAQAIAPLLSVRNIEVVYDNVILVLRGLSLDVPQGMIVALLGANGAGKSTTLKAISGLLKTEDGEVTRGEIVFNGERINGIDPDRIVRRGIIQVMEGRRIIADMTSLENLRLGAFTRSDNEVGADIDMVYRYFPRLKERTGLAGYLSGGEQQMLAIGRALMARPKMILMDEPSMGLSPLLVKEVFAIIREINRDLGVTILLVEQNARAALSVASHGYIMEQGKVVLDGSADELRDNEDVKEFYLGGAGDQRKSFKNLKSFKRRKRWL